MASNCKVIRAEIEESGGGAWLSRGARTHLDACAGCLDFMNERDSLRRLVGGLGRVEAPGDFEFRLRARMAAAKQTNAARPFVLRFAPGLASFALAAVFVTSIAAVYYFNRTTPTAGHATSHQSTVPTQTASQTSSPTVTNAATATTRTGDEIVNAVNKRTGATPSVNDERAGGVRPSRQERRRAATRATTEPRAHVARAQTEGALEFGLSTSQVIKGSNMKLAVSAEPLRVVVRDEHGTARRLAMKPVSFGAQNPVGKRRGLTGTAVADDEGVW